MKPFFYAFLFVLLSAGPAHSQQHVFVPGNHDAIHLFSVDIASCTSQMLDTVPIGVFTIAFTPDGRLWGVNNNLTNSILYQIDTTTGQVTLAGYFDSHDIYIGALTALNDSTLLFAGQNAPDSLYALNVNSMHSYLVGRTGYTCWGDLVWHKDELYMTGFPRNNSDSMFLLKIALNNNSYPPIASITRVCRLPEVFSHTLGLATVILPNMDTAMVVFADSSAYTINPITCSYQLLCNAIIPDSLYLSGAASLISHPSVPIIIDTVNPTGVVNPSNNRHMVKVYPNPVKDNLYIDFHYSPAAFVLTDIAGKVILRETLRNGLNEINMSLFMPGLYLASIQIDGNIIYRQKVVKNNSDQF